MKYLIIYVLFKSRHPGEIEIFRINPTDIPKFRMRRVKNDLILFPGEIAKEISLFLAAVDSEFEASIGKSITIAAANLHHLIKIGLDSYFFFQFAVQGFSEIFTFIDASLGKLPGTRVFHPFTDENFSIAVTQDARHVLPIIHAHRLTLSSRPFPASRMFTFLQSKSNWIVLGAILFMGYLLFFRWTSAAQLEKQQAALISGVEDNRWGRCEKRISARYEDRWGWKREDLRLVFQDFRSQFLVLGLRLEDPSWDIAGRQATLEARLRIEGTPWGLGASIQSRVNREPAPMIFYWEKESWAPWSWKLVRMNHPEVEVSDSYTPGDLLRARGMGN